MSSFKASTRTQRTNHFISGTSTSTIIFFSFFYSTSFLVVLSRESHMAFFAHLHYFLGAFLKKRTAQQFWKSEVKCWFQSINFFTLPQLFFRRLMETFFLVVPSRDRTWFFSTFTPLFGRVLEETHGATVLEVESQCWLKKKNFFTLHPFFSRRLMETSFLGVPSRGHTWLFPTLAPFF